MYLNHSAEKQIDLCTNTGFNSFSLLACGASFPFLSLNNFNSPQTATSIVETEIEFKVLLE